MSDYILDLRRLVGKRPLLQVGGSVICVSAKGEILLQRRRDNHAWCYPGGSVEHHNKEAGGVWIKRAVAHWPKSVWLNPEPQGHWKYHHSTKILHELMQGRMHGLTMSDIDEAMRFLSK